jgi:hypothetical protein
MEFPSQDVKPDSPVNRVITVKECMSLFNIHQKKTVIMAILTGRLEARKADSEIGQAGGTYLISYSSAFHIWGDRK